MHALLLALFGPAFQGVDSDLAPGEHAAPELELAVPGGVMPRFPGDEAFGASEAFGEHPGLLAGPLTDMPAPSTH